MPFTLFQAMSTVFQAKLTIFQVMSTITGHFPQGGAEASVTFYFYMTKCGFPQPEAFGSTFENE
jgi:hypothetical protein